MDKDAMEAFPNSNNDSDALNSNNLMMNVCQSVGQEIVRNIRDEEDDAVMESIAALRTREEGYMNDVRNKPRFCDMYLNFNIDESIFKIVEWKYKIVDAIDADRGLVGISMNFLDRFCTIRCCTVLQKFMNLQEFRLAALTCMYITLKVYGQLSVSAKVFAQIARDISPTQVTQYELVVLKALRFKISPPTAAMYLYQIFRLNHFIEREVQDYAIYLVELAMFDYSSIWSSRSAATLALCALCEAKALFKKVTNNLEENNQEIAEIVHNLSATNIMNVNATDIAAGSKILSEKYSSTCTSFCS